MALQLLGAMSASIPRLLDCDGAGEKGSLAAVVRGVWAYAHHIGTEGEGLMTSAGARGEEKAAILGGKRACTIDMSPEEFVTYGVAKLGARGFPTTQMGASLFSCMNPRYDCWLDRKAMVIMSAFNAQAYGPKDLMNGATTYGIRASLKADPGFTSDYGPVVGTLFESGKSLPSCFGQKNWSNPAVTYGVHAILRVDRSFTGYYGPILATYMESQGKLISLPSCFCWKTSELEPIHVATFASPLAMGTPLRNYSGRRHIKPSPRRTGIRKSDVDVSLWKAVGRFLKDVGYTSRGPASRVFSSFVIFTITCQGFREINNLYNQMSDIARLVCTSTEVQESIKDFLLGAVRSVEEDDWLF